MSTVLSSDSEIRNLLQSVRSIAVVGLSESSSRPSFGVARYLMDAGYEVIPVNPHISSWQGIPTFPSVAAIGKTVDLVDVFRRPEFVLETVEDAIAAHSGIVWTQLGVISNVATKRAVDSGMPIVVDRCTAIEHRRLIASPEALR
jgi:predicted CoA-binding protein